MNGKQIKKLRLSLALTQAEFGKLVGVVDTLVSHWEHGRRKLAGPALMVVKQIKADAAKRPEGLMA